MLRRFASVVAVGAMALTSYAVMVAAPASAGRFGPNEVEVTKVVVGDNPGGGFLVVVTCEGGGLDRAIGGSFSQALVFGPEGGTDSVGAPAGSTCTVTEPGTGGASKIEISGSPCVFPPDEMAPQPIAPAQADGETCPVTVTNTFEPPAAGPAGPPGPPGEAAAAPAVVARARFTG